MQAPAANPPLRNITDHLNGDEFRRMLLSAIWAPACLGALSLTVLERVNLHHFITPPPFLVDEDIEPGGLIEGPPDDKPFSEAADARTQMLKSIIFTAEIRGAGREKAIHWFIKFVLIHLTRYVFPLASEISEIAVKGFCRRDHLAYLTLRYNNRSRSFSPCIAVHTSAGAPILTVFTPLPPHGNPNCQLVGYLLAVSRKYFSRKPQCFIHQPFLIHLAHDSLAYFASAVVTRWYLDSVEDGTVEEDGEGLPVRISNLFDLKIASERERFVRALASVYGKLLNRELPASFPPSWLTN